MNWKPIEEKILKENIQKDAALLPDYEYGLFQRHAVPIFRLPCFRTTHTGQELIFVVAQLKEHVIVFDDVEDEYGVGIIKKGEPLKDWCLYGSLKDALVGMNSL